MCAPYGPKLALTKLWNYGCYVGSCSKLQAELQLQYAYLHVDASHMRRCVSTASRFQGEPAYQLNVTKLCANQSTRPNLNTQLHLAPLAAMDPP
jgi:hypothetical protein